MLLGRTGSIRIAVPACTIRRSISWYSSGEPSHQRIWSGWHSAATWFTHSARCWCLVIGSPLRASHVILLERGPILNRSGRFRLPRRRSLATLSPAGDRPGACIHGPATRRRPPSRSPGQDSSMDRSPRPHPLALSAALSAGRTAPGASPLPPAAAKPALRHAVRPAARPPAAAPRSAAGAAGPAAAPRRPQPRPVRRRPRRSSGHVTRDGARGLRDLEDAPRPGLHARRRGGEDDRRPRPGRGRAARSWPPGAPTASARCRASSRSTTRPGSGSGKVTLVAVDRTKKDAEGLTVKHEMLRVPDVRLLPRRARRSAASPNGR